MRKTRGHGERPVGGQSWACSAFGSHWDTHGREMEGLAVLIPVLTPLSCPSGPRVDPALPYGSHEGKSPNVPDHCVFILKMEVLAATSELEYESVTYSLGSVPGMWSLMEREPSLSYRWHLLPISPSTGGCACASSLGSQLRSSASPPSIPIPPTYTCTQACPPAPGGTHSPGWVLPYYGMAWAVSFGYTMPGHCIKLPDQHRASSPRPVLLL